MPDIVTSTATNSTGSEQAGAAGDGTPKPGFGERFRYGGGLAVTVERPKRFTPSEWVEKMPGVPMRFVVVVTNRTGDIWNPSQLHVRLASGFSPAEQIFDYDNGVVARPEERVPNGDTVRFAVGYWVTQPDQILMEFAPGFGYQAVSIGG